MWSPRAFTGVGWLMLTLTMKIKPSKTFIGSDLGAEEDWKRYLDTLDWNQGHRDDASWRAFLRAKSLHVEPNSAVDEVAARIKTTGGYASLTKLISQLQRAYGRPVGVTCACALAPAPKIEFSPDKLKQVAARVPPVDADWLIKNSPIAVAELNSGAVLEELFNPGEHVLCFNDFRSQGQCLYTVGKDLNPLLPSGGEGGAWFLVNPVDGFYHPNPRQGEKSSRRSEESVTSWRYLVLESDVAETSEWLRCLVQLPLRISAVYTSGGKSIHALVRLDANTKAEWDQQRDLIKPTLVTLGADEAAMSAVRLSRLPGAMRGDRLQQLLYLNPAAQAAPIYNPEPHSHE